MKQSFNPRALDTIRYRHGIRTDKALADELNVNPATIVRWRKGDMTPSLATAALMVSKYEIEWSDIFQAADDETSAA